MNNRSAYRFSSCFANHFIAFIAFKRSIGYKYGAEECILKRLDKFLVTEKYAGDGLSQEVIEKWLCRKKHETRRSQLSRVSIMRQLANYTERHLELSKGLKVFGEASTQLRLELCPTAKKLLRL